MHLLQLHLQVAGWPLASGQACRFLLLSTRGQKKMECTLAAPRPGEALFDDVVAGFEKLETALGMQDALTLTASPTRLTVVKLPAGAPLPRFLASALTRSHEAKNEPFVTIARDTDGITAILPTKWMEDDDDDDDTVRAVRVEKDWRALRAKGARPLNAAAAVASLTRRLESAGIDTLVQCTFEGQYVLVRCTEFDAAVRALERGGHIVVSSDADRAGGRQYPRGSIASFFTKAAAPPREETPKRCTQPLTKGRKRQQTLDAFNAFGRHAQRFDRLAALRAAEAAAEAAALPAAATVARNECMNVHADAHAEYARPKASETSHVYENGAPERGISAAAALEFGRLVGRLKIQKRRGWLLRGIDKGEAESVADHMYRMACLAFLVGTPANSSGAIGCTSDERVSPDRCVAIALVHDIAEAVVGDLTPFDDVPKAEKHARELAVVEKIEAMLGPAVGGKIAALWREYEDRSSPEGRLVKDIDKFEMVLQADEYERAHASAGLCLDGFFESVRGKIKSSRVRGWFAALEADRATRLAKQHRPPPPKSLPPKGARRRKAGTRAREKK
jgi:putative hydrolase of HD superfamily